MDSACNMKFGGCGGGLHSCRICKVEKRELQKIGGPHKLLSPEKYDQRTRRIKRHPKVKAEQTRYVPKTLMLGRTVHQGVGSGVYMGIQVSGGKKAQGRGGAGQGSSGSHEANRDVLTCIETTKCNTSEWHCFTQHGAILL